MKAIIKYEIYEIAESKGWVGGKVVPQKTAKMNVYHTMDKSDPNYVYGQVSGGSTQTLSTTNANVYDQWFIGAILTSEMSIEPAKATA